MDLFSENLSPKGVTMYHAFLREDAFDIVRECCLILT